MSDAGVESSPAPLVDWLGWRDRLLGSPRFQRLSLAFPPFRWVARRKARQLFDLCAGFVYSQVFLACVDLDLFDLLAAGPHTAAAVGRQVGLAEDAARRLLDAARALDLVQQQKDGRYRLGSLGAALRANPGVAAMVAHHRLLYADLADPVALLRGTAGPRALACYWGYAGSNDPASLGASAVTPYTTLMAASQAMVAAEILHAYPLRRHRHLLDIGGGDGTFVAAAGTQARHLRLSLFDLPAVTERAHGTLSRAGLIDRVALTGGDFRIDPLPRGADVATLVRILHDHDDDVVFALMQAVRKALEPDGRLLVAEPMADTPGVEPVGHAYFGFYLLAMGRGRPRTADELGRMLGEAGFRNIRRVPTRMPLLTSLIAADA